jgi:hypothetical protein
MGRQLFAEALDDEDHHRYAAALEKYRRVLEIRETASIHYRMGATLEGLGRVREALAEYGAAVRLGTGSADAEVVRASNARIDALEAKAAHLSVRLGSNTPADAEVRVDDTPVGREALGDVRLDPGPHVVTVAAPDGRTSRAEATISEGGRVEIPIALEAPAPRPEPPRQKPPLRTIGIVTGAGGIVLLAGGLVFLGLRSSAISDLESSCPNGNCPRAREAELTDTHDAAVHDGPIAGTLLGVGALALGAGIVLFTLGGDDGATSVRVAPAAGGMTLGLARPF